MVTPIGQNSAGSMNANIKMNSSELQKIFYTVYKDFFNTHDIVLSGPSILTWGPDISHGVSALRIKQKLPVKTYCGANFNTSGRVTFGKMLAYSILDNSFQETELNTFFKSDIDDITSFLQCFLVGSGYTGGVDINLLFESPPGHGFSFSGVISVLLTFLMHIKTGKLDIQKLTNREFSLDDVLFEEIYAFSLQISSSISAGRIVGGSSNYTVMLPDHALPLVHISHKCIHDEHTENIIENEKVETHRCINHILYKGCLVDFLGKDSIRIEELPLDYGVIFTGLEYRFTDIVAIREQRQHEEKALNSFISQIVQSLPLPNTNEVIVSALLTFEKDDVIYKNIDHMNLKILEGFDSLFNGTPTDTSVDIFIDNIRKMGLSSFSYQKENKIFGALQYLFHFYQQFDDEKIGIIPFNSGRAGGSLFFVMKKGNSRNTIQKVLEHLQNDGHSVSLDYASWRDGYSSDGVRLEQYLSEKLYSDYTREGDVLFTDSFGKSYSGEYDTIIKNETDCLLLDTVGGRVYIKGTKLTSKEIHSQNTTIDMLKLLLENIGKEISNSRLPVSTYSQNKNEILSKIVFPIKKITKKSFGKEISLTCSGGITDYYLRLDLDNSVRLGIIKKLQN